jgi:hypothetical protein
VVTRKGRSRTYQTDKGIGSISEIEWTGKRPTQRDKWLVGRADLAGGGVLPHEDE